MDMRKFSNRSNHQRKETQMSLTTWIPALAAKHGTPEPVMHMTAQRLAGSLGITWGMDMPESDVRAVSAAVDARYAR
jgi:hypothetical protein